jgi:ATP-dependent DNA helicase RecG
MSGLMLTFQANPQHLIAALGPEDARRVLGEKVGEKVGKRVGESLTPNQKRIISILRQNTRLSALELAEEVGISSRKIEQNIARLKESGILFRIGPTKGGYWEVLK